MKARLVSLALAVVVATAAPAWAQLGRPSASQSIIPGALLYNDIAYDSVNNVYLSVIAWGDLYGAFITSTGTVISAFQIPGPNAATAFANNPRVSFSPASGGFLVAWHHNAEVHTAVVKYPGGVVSVDPGGAAVSGGTVSVAQAGGPTSAYSPDSQKTLVAWTYVGAGWGIQARLVSGSTGVPAGLPFTLIAGGGQNPSVAWNPVTHEFGVAYATDSGGGQGMALARVSAEGQLLGTTAFGASPGTYNTAIAVNGAGHYIVGWATAGGARSVELNGAGAPLASVPTLIGSRLGTPTSFALALNPVSGTVLAVSEDAGGSKEAIGVELNSSGVPLALPTLLTDGAVGGGAAGSYSPRVTPRTNAKEWSISYSRFRTNYELANQIITTGSVDTPAGPTGPPPPPPPTAVSINSFGASRTLGTMVGGTPVTFTAGASGGSAGLVYEFQRWRPTTGWQTVRGFASSNTATLVTVPGQQIVRVNVKQSTSGSTEASRESNSFTGIATRSLSLDAAGGGDVFAYNAANGGGHLISGDLGVMTETNYGLGWGANRTVVAGDFNGDGLSDLFTYNPGTGQAQRAINIGGNSFDYTDYLWAGGLTVVAGDFNGDGRDDIFTYSKSTGVWTKQLTDSANVFQQSSGLWSTDWEVYTGDFNGDGVTDFFVYNKNSANAGAGRWFRVINAANGTFAGYYQGSIPVWSPTWTVVPGDYDGDGKTDIFLYGPDGRWYKVFFPTLGGPERYVNGLWSTDWTPRAGDFNGDGKDDIFVLNRNTGRNFVVASTGDGWVYYENQLQWSAGWVPTVVDINRDRLADLIVYDPTNGRWYQVISSSLPAQFGYYTGPNMETGLTMIASGGDR